MNDVASTASDEEVVPLIVEEAHIRTTEVVTGRVRVESKFDRVDENVVATLTSESVEVTHHPVNREVAEVPAIRTEGDTTIIPIVEEVLVVEKRLVLKEEVHIRRRSSTEE